MYTRKKSSKFHARYKQFAFFIFRTAHIHCKLKKNICAEGARNLQSYYLMVFKCNAKLKNACVPFCSLVEWPVYGSCLIYTSAAPNPRNFLLLKSLKRRILGNGIIEKNKSLPLLIARFRPIGAFQTFCYFSFSGPCANMQCKS